MRIFIDAMALIGLCGVVGLLGAFTLCCMAMAPSKKTLAGKYKDRR